MEPHCPICCRQNPIVYEDQLGNRKNLHSTMKCCGKVICLTCVEKSFREYGCPYCRSFCGNTFIDLGAYGDLELVYQERTGRNETLRLTIEPSERTLRMFRSTLKRTPVACREDFLKVTNELFEIVLSCCVYNAENRKDEPLLRAVFSKQAEIGAKVVRISDTTYMLEEGGTIINFSWKALWPPDEPAETGGD